MKINIDALSEAELIDLNHRVVARLKFLHEAHSHKAMLDFRIGERVIFYPDGRPPVVGILTRYNRKSVSVLTEDGQSWTVAPTLLHKFTRDTNTPAKPTSGDTVIEGRAKRV